MRHATGEGRTVLHTLPVDYRIDGVKGVRDPRGMVARQFGVDLHVVTADAAVARNLMLVVERCHLNVEAMAASPYAAGLAVLTDDEADLGAAVVEMGAGSTTIAIHSGGRFVHAAGFAVGGHHITMDLARGLSACIADAERIKTLYGTVLTGGSDARELMSVPTAGDNDRDDVPQIVSRATIANIVRHRAEEIFEMVRDRLKDSPFAAEPKARVVLSGGASQLTGLVELATQILGRPVRIGRPLGFGRLPAEAKTASFAVPAGLLVYPQYAHLEHVEPRHTRHLRTGTDGYFGKVGRWLREGF
jgi:cell division protein FtsA